MELPGTASPLEPFGHGRGYVDHLTPAAPAAGAGLIVPLDPTFIWRPLSIRFGLTTSAAVANRIVTVDYTDPEGNVWVRNGAAVAVTASTTAQGFDFNAQRTVAEWNTGTDVLAPLSDFFIPGGWQIRINVGGIDAADQLLTPRLYVEKWVTGAGVDLGGAAYAGALATRSRR